MSVWVVEPLIVYLLLAFPFGRLAGRAERVVFQAAVAVAAVLYLAPTLLTARFPEPVPVRHVRRGLPRQRLHARRGRSRRSSGTSCDPCARCSPRWCSSPSRDCSRGAWGRAADAGPPHPWPRAGDRADPGDHHRGLRACPDGRGGDPGDRVPGDGSSRSARRCWRSASSAGLLSARLYVALSVLERLTRRLRADVTPSELTAEMADALEDPSLRIVYDAIDAPGQWCDEEGRPATAPRARAGRAVSTVRVSGRAAAIEHDDLLRLEPGVVEAAATYAITALEHDWLVRELQSSLRELSESRARIVTVGAQARRRIERDLHDGAQQRLVALRAHLGLPERAAARGRAALGGRAGGPRAHRRRDDRRGAVDRARDLPVPARRPRALVEALRAAALGAPLAARVDAEGVGRYDPEIETDRLLRVHRGAPERGQARGRRDGRLDLAVRHRQPPLRGPGRRGGLRESRRTRPARGSRTCATASRPSAGW